jgi:lactate permease
MMSPGTVLLGAGVVTLLLYRASGADYRLTALNAGRAVLVSAAALLPTLIMVQIFVNSGLNTAGLDAMPTFIAHLLAAWLGPVWLIVSPLVGALTAFIVGSSTVSTLTMAPVQASVAEHLAIPVDVAMAQQISGANAGNIIAIHNVVAASTVVKLHHQEGRIIRRTILFVGIYLLCSIIGTFLLLLALQ